MLAGHAYGNEAGSDFMLNCADHLYPRQWIYLYACDLSTGLISLALMNWFDYTLDMGEPCNLEEFNLLKR